MMRAFFGNKRLVLLLAMLALVALTVLAIGLNGLPMREAQRFAQPGGSESDSAAKQMRQILTAVPSWKQTLVWILALGLVILIGMLVSPELRKRMLMIFVRAVFTFWAVYFLLLNYGDRLLPQPEEGIAAPQAGNPSALPPPVFEPPQVSPTVSYLVSFACALLWMAGAWALYRGWKKFTLLHSKPPLEDIARIARASLHQLSSGRNSGDVIIECYLRMSDVVADKQKLQRAAAMTPHEFAQRLEQAGLPGDAVRRLTRLFEIVRYGDRASGPQEMNEAMSCLRTILHYCGEPV